MHLRIICISIIKSFLETRGRLKDLKKEVFKSVVSEKQLYETKLI